LHQDHRPQVISTHALNTGRVADIDAKMKRMISLGNNLAVGVILPGVVDAGGWLTLAPDANFKTLTRR